MQEVTAVADMHGPHRMIHHVRMHTGREEAVVERSMVILGPVKVFSGGHTEHRHKHMARAHYAPWQHGGVWQAVGLCLKAKHYSVNSCPNVVVFFA